MSDRIWYSEKWTPEGPYEMAIFIEKVRGSNGATYAIRDRLGQCLNHKALFEYEPMPSSRTASFLKRCRFDSIQKAQDAYEKWEKKTIKELSKETPDGR